MAARACRRSPGAARLRLRLRPLGAGGSNPSGTNRGAVRRSCSSRARGARDDAGRPLPGRRSSRRIPGYVVEVHPEHVLNPVIAQRVERELDVAGELSRDVVVAVDDHDDRAELRDPAVDHAEGGRDVRPVELAALTVQSPADACVDLEVEPVDSVASEPSEPHVTAVRIESEITDTRGSDDAVPGVAWNHPARATAANTATAAALRRRERDIGRRHWRRRSQVFVTAPADQDGSIEGCGLLAPSPPARPRRARSLLCDVS